MNQQLRIFRNIVLPLMVLLPLIAIMVGCIYIPTWERVDLGTTKQDFRPIAGGNSKNPLRVGITTRADIEKVLGEPQYSTPSGLRVVYLIETHRGIWTAPLCAFLVDKNAHNEQIALDINYRPDGVLQNFQIHIYKADPGPPNIMEISDDLSLKNTSPLIWDMNHPQQKKVPTTDRFGNIREEEEPVPPAEFLSPTQPSK